MSKSQLGPGETVEWFTPAYILDAAQAVLGPFDCDPASPPPPYPVPARVHYTKAENGLLLPWAGTVWLNPPYGREMPPFLHKLAAELAIRRCTAAITLTPANTDTRWFQRLWEADALCFHYGRVQFLGGKSSGNVTGNVLGYFGPDAARFAEVFAPLGRIVYPNAPYRRQAHQLTLLEAVS